MKRVLLVVTVALVMVAMVLVMAMPVFAQNAEKRQGPPESPPGYAERTQKDRSPYANRPETGPRPGEVGHNMGASLLVVSPTK